MVRLNPDNPLDLAEVKLALLEPANLCPKGLDLLLRLRLPGTSDQRRLLAVDRLGLGKLRHDEGVDTSQGGQVGSQPIHLRSLDQAGQHPQFTLDFE